MTRGILAAAGVMVEILNKVRLGQSLIPNLRPEG
jgi:hypothetical protein